jgi:hypothetical protein
MVRGIEFVEVVRKRIVRTLLNVKDGHDRRRGIINNISS